MKRIAVIGASYLQEPIITKAKEMGIETHVFAWASDDVGEKAADFFYPISIVEKEEIFETCKKIGIDGICSISSDLAVVTVNYVADKLGLVCNSPASTLMTTNKHEMRMAFEKNGDPSPFSMIVSSKKEINNSLSFPVIVKPLDRSGSRGICKVDDADGLDKAISNAIEQGFIKKALVEEYVEGNEYSVECISYNGEHHLLAVTYKYTTGAPGFIETGHLQPSGIDSGKLKEIEKVVFHALDSLEIKYGASHSEIKINENGKIRIIEIGARMGGDFIGSALVELTTGIDFLKAVIQISLGEDPKISQVSSIGAAGVRFIFSKSDIEMYNKLKKEHPEYLVKEDIPITIDGEVKDSSSRFGYFLFRASRADDIVEYMPKDMESGK